MNFLSGEAGPTGTSQSLIKTKILKKSTKQEREDILSELGRRAEMDEKDGLAMMADISSTWYTYQKWGRLAEFIYFTSVTVPSSLISNPR